MQGKIGNAAEIVQKLLNMKKIKYYLIEKLIRFYCAMLAISPPNFNSPLILLPVQDPVVAGRCCPFSPFLFNRDVWRSRPRPRLRPVVQRGTAGHRARAGRGRGAGGHSGKEHQEELAPLGGKLSRPGSY